MFSLLHCGFSPAKRISLKSDSGTILFKFQPASVSITSTFFFVNHVVVKLYSSSRGIVSVSIGSYQSDRNVFPYFTAALHFSEWSQIADLAGHRPLTSFLASLLKSDKKCKFNIFNYLKISSCRNKIGLLTLNELDFLPSSLSISVPFSLDKMTSSNTETLDQSAFRNCPPNLLNFH